ncbi:Uncharacterised protein [Acholeplasma oculi]|uniref:DUF4422 domain-containing protein n=1 Tax=Acholeplasma oculi TaxID=35623 RepID=A0A061AFY9_9MOLU|nr:MULTISPECIES: DUF4422 domain-containing protein [Acholeplasma]MBG0763194.1 DUF4422 domain-containing protein [Acholeplasma laidlawii]CDR30491.1 hypothetical protein, DUF4422 [Acholeplasma oculi]SKC48047.1 protein of unknown function [Acholeplasma oculi]SUT89121.1 Uncharacterised protein [Acholeplasma oculi]
MEDIKVYVTTHKETDIINKKITSIYQKLFVGAENKIIPEGYLSDSFPGGISHKNKNYSELTGQYYIWKNANAKIVGLIHYRRILSKSKSNFFYKALNEKQIKKALSKADVIVPKREKMLRHTVESYYSKAHYKKDYEIIREIISEKHPDYVEAFEKVSNQKHLFLANILITKKEYFDQYSEWLFSVLFELEKRSDITSYDSYQARIYGFISERLINVWIEKNNLKVKEYRMINLDQNQLLFKLKKVRYKIMEFFEK